GVHRVVQHCTQFRGTAPSEVEELLPAYVVVAAPAEFSRSSHRTQTIARGPATIPNGWADEMDYTLGEMTQGEAPEATLGIVIHPGAGPLLRLGVKLVIEAYERDPQATLARLGDAAARGDEFQVPPELLATE